MRTDRLSNSEDPVQMEAAAKGQGGPRQDPYSYLVLLLYMGYAFFVGSSIAPFSPIFKALKVAYDIELPSVLLSSVFFLAGKILLSVFAGAILSIAGLRYGVFGCLLVFFLGVTLRLGIEASWEYVLLGQLICGMAATFIITAQLQFCQVWFPVATRGLFVTLTSFSMIVGGAFSSFFVLLFVDEKEADVEAIKHGVHRFNTTSAFIYGMLAALHVSLFRESPRKGYYDGHKDGKAPGGPAQAQENSGSEITEPFITAGSQALLPRDSRAFKHFLKDLLSQRAFTICAMVYFLLCCANVIISSNINFLCAALDYPEKVAGVAALLVIVGGVLGSAFFFKFLMSVRRGVAHYAAYMATGLVCLVLAAILGFARWSTAAMLGAVFTFGFFAMPGLPIILEIMLRTVKRVPFPFINGVIYFGAQSITTLAVFLISRIYENSDIYTGSVCVVGLLCALFIVSIIIILQIKL